METTHEHPDRDRTVTIIVNNDPHKTTAGKHTVKEIKLLAHVPLADDLEEVIHGKLVPLDDNATVEVKNGDHFISHPKDSGSS